ncbi:hypothetical protein ABW21_db0206681 [Orbilia brochopaga]|nr:hypothetical protein ABW21_db0206681 [Drechslerella brochopaga]
MSHPSQTPADPAAPIFADDEETESFYVVLDLSGDDFATYHNRYRNGHARRPRRSSHSSSSSPPSDEDDIADDEDPDKQVDEDDDGEDEDEDDGDEEDDDSSSSSDDTVDSSTERALQILDLDTYEPLVMYQGKIFRCTWSTSTGTELIFDSPDDTTTLHPSTTTSTHHYSALEEEQEEEEKGRKLRTYPEARLLATTVHRLDGYPAKLRLRGRDKAEVSTKARMFAERLDAVLEHRVAEMAERGEDVSAFTMRKFSEGQTSTAVLPAL